MSKLCLQCEIVYKRDRQTDRQKLNVFGRCGGVQNPRPTKPGTVIENRQHVLVSQKGLMHSFVTRGC